MRDVTIRLYPSADAAEPELTATMPNAAFDNDTLRVFTAPMPADPAKGRPAVAGDRVPVNVRGVDYDFDGQGLTLRINQRERQVQALEIAHGGRMVIKNPGTLGETLEPSGAPRPRGGGAVTPPAGAAPTPGAVARGQPRCLGGRAGFGGLQPPHPVECEK